MANPIFFSLPLTVVTNSMDAMEKQNENEKFYSNDDPEKRKEKQ